MTHRAARVTLPRGCDTRSRRRPNQNLPLDALLTFEEVRVLGCLLEKEMATPEYYPLTSNALLAACNQTTSREPVASFDEATMQAALTLLRQKQMAAMIHLAGSRVPKYKHLLDEYYPGLGRPEFALLAVLLLRGPQTVAELRSRTERLHQFGDLPALEDALRRLVQYGNGPLATFLPAGGGRRAPTYAHLLSGQPAPSAPVAQPPAGTVVPPPPDRSAGFEAQLAELRKEITTLTARLKHLEDSLGVPSGQ